ncbi:Opine dehydrogenase [Gracilariopsis chorda]|uniref:Opine dehydrogenase n=1 Tax=Gracilariopsis chorda TaxID=448386 RepID=A0A2V3J4M3_9FLOR|nr:Opine dehydrogenase [Gracilariopsis chorda]|eukprot:PXF49406.1 Opine dehydrogenase [Gracilariopsis chorda]
MFLKEHIKQICVVGGGNAAQVVGALLGQARENGSAVRCSILAPFGDEAQRLTDSAKPNGGITLENPDGSFTKGMPDIITNDPEKALKDTQIVLLPLPLFAMPPMLKLIEPHLEPGTWVGALPAQGGFQWIANSILDTSPTGKGIKVFGFDKLPYNCRTVEYGKLVKVFGYKEDLALACIPHDTEIASRMASTISAVIPKLKMYTVPSFLVITLATSNQCIHPARMYGLFAKEPTRDRVPLFYEEMDDYSAQLIGSVSDETLAIARGLEKTAKETGGELDLSGVLSIRDSTMKVYEVEDSSSLAKVFATCTGFLGIRTPMKQSTTTDGKTIYEVDWNCRYFTEDIPALCVLRGLAQIAGVEVPTIDMLIRWAQKHFSEPYEFLKEDGKLNEDHQKLMYTPQYWGISTAEELLKFHGALRA